MKKNILRRIMGYLKPYKISLFFVLLFAGISTVFTVLAPFIMGEVTTQLYAGVSTGIFAWEIIAGLLILLSLIYLIGQVFAFFQNFWMSKITARVLQDLRSEIDTKMHRMKLNYYDIHTNGEILSVITNDVDTINNAIGQNLTQIVTHVITAVGILLMMLRISTWLTLIAVIMVPLSLIASAGVVKSSAKHYAAQQNLLGELNGYIEEMYNGQTVVQAFNYQDRANTNFSKINTALYESAQKAEIASGTISPITSLVNNIGYVSSAALGCLWVLTGKMTIGNVQAMLQYTNPKVV